MKQHVPPPHRKQLRTAKRRERKFLKLKHFLVDVEKSERKKMLEKKKLAKSVTFYLASSVLLEYI